jgi:hypothetical protein
MSKKPTKLVGLSYSNFNTIISKGQEIHLQPARLIPFYKPGNELALASIFMSALRLVKEFRINISKAINLTRSGSIHIFTEVEFLLFEKKRVDGLILIVRGKNIVDAVLIEVKNKNVELNKEQISDYLNIAKEYNIPKLLTISNQFVSFPTQSPLSLKTPKQVKLYHLSWSFILTIAHILLADNENNIEDEDQIEIMKEIVDYFESKNSGVVGFTQMKPGWVDIVNKANSGTSLKLNDISVEETVSSWLQEERDMALILSRELGLLVRSGQSKFKNNLKARINYEKRELISKLSLQSVLQIDGAASNIIVRANFDRRNIEMSATLSPPQDRKERAQITWIRNQIKRCEKKNPELFEKLRSDLMVDINIKYSSEPIRLPLEELEYAFERIKGKEIKSFNILLIRYLGRKFASRSGFVTIIEKMLIDYYQGIVQYLKKWEKPVPQIPQKDVGTKTI